MKADGEKGGRGDGEKKRAGGQSSCLAPSPRPSVSPSALTSSFILPPSSFKSVVIEELFKNRKPVVGVIHVGALPGTPASQFSVDELTELAAREAALYRDAGVDAVAVETIHDVPYTRGS